MGLLPVHRTYYLSLKLSSHGFCTYKCPTSSTAIHGVYISRKALCMQVWLLPSFLDAQRAALLAACRAVIYTPENEHFGIVPLEAMASSRPVIACNSGGPKESVLSGITGFLCEPQPRQFAHAMEQLLVCLPPEYCTMCLACPA